MYRVEQQDSEDLLVEEPSVDYLYTYADYLKWRIEDRLELFKGRIHRMSGPNTTHQRISLELSLCIGNFLRNRDCQLFTAPFDVRLPVQNKKKDNEVITVVQPDLCVICDLQKLDERGCIGAPDLVVEILSPGSSKAEVQNKYELYEESGVQEYWIVYPPHHTLTIYTLHNGKYIGSKPFTTGEILTSTILPGLQINLEQIFKT